MSSVVGAANQLVGTAGARAGVWEWATFSTGSCPMTEDAFLLAYKE